MLKPGKVTISGDDTVDIRQLSGKSLRRAAQARAAEAAQNATGYGADLVKLFSEDTPEKKAERERKAALPEARYERYDRGLVLTQGVTGWSRDEKLGTDPEDQLTDEDAEKVFRAIVDLSVPTKDEAEAALKND